MVKKEDKIFIFIFNVTLSFKNRKHNVRLKIRLHWKIFCYLKILTIFEKITTLTHWKYWMKFNVEIFSNIYIELSCNNNYLTSKNTKSKSMSKSVQTHTLTMMKSRATQTRHSYIYICCVWPAKRLEQLSWTFLWTLMVGRGML